MTCPLCGSPAKPETQDGFPLYDVRALIAEGIMAKLVLDGQIYTLRITRAGKLILTK